MSPLGARKHEFTAAIYGDDVETDVLGIFTLAEEDSKSPKGGLVGSSYDYLHGRTTKRTAPSTRRYKASGSFGTSSTT